MSYPILMAGDRNLDVKETEQDAITTTVSSGRNFLEVKIIDSSGVLYDVKKVTPFGRKSVWLDMGTSPFQVFLELKRVREVTLDQSKAIVMDIVREPHGLTNDSPHTLQTATEKIQRCRSLPELFETCRLSYSWR